MKKNAKKILIILGITGILFSLNSRVFAEEPTYIDMTKIMTNYDKAQELTADLKAKKTDLQKFVADAEREIKIAKVSEQKQMQEKYNKELKEKEVLYKKQYLEELQKVQNNIQDAVKSVAKSKNINSIFHKSSIAFGGTDLTDEVLVILKDKK